MRAAFACFVYFVLCVHAWEPPLLRLSDLPDVHYTPAVVSLPTGHTPPPVSSDICTRFQTCFKCADRDDVCGWCTAGDGSGKCMALAKGREQCIAKGGTIGDMSSCPFLTTDLIITSILIGACALLSAGGGIGGGALFVPIYLMIYGLTAHQAVPLSKVTILGLGIGGFTVLFFQRHPKRNAPQIDYDLVSVMVPMILLGTIGGVYLNVVLPSFVIITSLVILLAVTSYRSWKKAFSMYAIEVAAAKQLRSEIIDIELDEVGEATPDKNHNNRTSQSVVSDALQPILDREAATPWKKFAMFLIMYAGLLTYVILKGTSHGASIIGVTCGSVGFFVLTAAVVPYMVILLFLVGRRILREYREKVAAGYQFFPEDIVYTPKTIATIGALSFGSGVAAGSLGIGAGMVVAPIMLELGVLAEIAQASSSFMVLFTSSSTSIQFILLGKLPWKAAICFWCIGFFASILGQHLVAYLLKKFQKQYVITFFLAAMITLSGIFMFGLQIHDMARDGLHFTGFRSACSNNIG